MPTPNTASKYVNGFDPRNISGLLMWVDGQDPNGNGTLPANGATVSTWVDRSGNGRNMTATGAPTYVLSSKGVNVAGAAYLGNTSITNSVMTVFMVFNRTGTGTSPAFSFNLTTGASGFYPNSLVGATVAQTNSVVYSSGLLGSLAVDQIFVVVVQYDDNSNMTVWVNGNYLFIIPYVNQREVFTRTGFYLGYQGGTKYFTGTYYEVLVYNSALSLFQKQEIEGYLEYKWKLNFPTITYSPTSAGNLMLWFDANDTSSVQVNGEYRVTQWNDKSGNNRHANPPNINQAPYYFQASKQVFFPRSSNAYLNLPNSSLPTGNSLYSYFIVLCFDRVADGMGVIGGGNYGTNNGVFALRSLGASSGQIHQYWWNNDLTSTAFVYQPNKPFLLTATWDGFRYTHVNGYIIAGDTPAVGRNQGTNNNTIGVTGGLTEYMGGYIQEIIVLSNVNGTDNQNITTYLLNKWGLRTLNSNHPFKLYSTPSRFLQPIDIESCVLWLDGQDITTVTITPGTSNITNWRDKSATQTNAVANRSGSRQVSWTGNGIYIDNGLTSTGFDINNYSQLTIQSNFQNTANYSIFAVVNYLPKTNGWLQCIYANFRSNRSPDSRAPNFGVGSTFQFNNPPTTTIGFDLYQGSPNSRGLFELISDSTTFRYGVNGYMISTAVPTNFIRFSTDSGNGGLPTIGGTYDVAGNQSGDGRFATGTVHEIIMYNQAVSETDRLMIEGYLANKWGLTLNTTGTSVPASSLLPNDPSINLALQIWNDATSYSTNNQALTTWINKGNAPITPACTGSPTVLTGQLNGQPIVRFATTSTWTTGTGAFNYSSYTMFFVGRQRGGTNARVLRSITYNELYGYWGGRKRVIYIGDNPRLIEGPTYGTVSDSAWDIFSHSRTNNGPFVMYWNGVLLYGAQGSVATNLVDLVINLGGEPSDCDVAEIILYNRVLSDTQQEGIMIYLANKWGLTLQSQTQPFTTARLPDSLPLTPAMYAYPTYGSRQNLFSIFFNMTQSNPSTTPGSTGWGNQIGTCGYYNPINFQDGDGRIGQSDQVGIVCTGWVYSANGGTIQFRIVVDDGGYLIFNGVPVITNAWILQGDTGYNTAYLQLNPGFNSIEFRFFEWQGGMTCELYYALNYSTTWVSDGASVFYATPSILSCWFDSADATTVSLSQNNGVLAQWADKSGSGFDMNQRLMNGPTYTLANRTIRFNNNRDLVVPTGMINNATRWTMIFMFNPISSTNFILSKQRDNVNSYNILSMTQYNGTGNTTGNTGWLYFRARNQGTLASSGSALSTNTNQIITLNYDGTNLTMFRNGTTLSTTAGDFVIVNDLESTGSYMGVWVVSNLYQSNSATDFIMYEFMFFNSDLPLAGAQRMEGYLAWKWGLVGALPASHPYKKIRP